MNVDIQALNQKYPGHIFTMREDTLFCDDKLITKVNRDTPPDKKMMGLTEQDLFERVVEMGVRLLEDPHYYDYDVALKRKQCRESSES